MQRIRFDTFAGECYYILDNYLENISFNYEWIHKYQKSNLDNRIFHIPDFSFKPSLYTTNLNDYFEKLSQEVFNTINANNDFANNTYLKTLQIRFGGHNFNKNDLEKRIKEVKWCIQNRLNYFKYDETVIHTAEKHSQSVIVDFDVEIQPLLNILEDFKKNIILFLRMLIEEFEKGNLKHGKSTKQFHKPPKNLPDLQNLFREREYFNLIISKLKEYYRYDREKDEYYWTGGKEVLAALAVKLKEKNRLKNELHKDNNQYLKRVFCKFFNIKISDKTFQPNRINTIKIHNKDKFPFITDFKS